MNRRHTTRTAVYIIIEREDQVLLLKRGNTGYRDGYYSLPTGHVDAGETFREAAVRETREETGLEVMEMRFRGVMHRDSRDAHYVDIYFQATSWKGEPENMEPEKHSSLGWFPRDSLPQKTMEPARDVIENGMENFFEERGFE